MSDLSARADALSRSYGGEEELRRAELLKLEAEILDHERLASEGLKRDLLFLRARSELTRALCSVALVDTTDEDLRALFEQSIRNAEASSNRNLPVRSKLTFAGYLVGQGAMDEALVTYQAAAQAQHARVVHVIATFRWADALRRTGRYAQALERIAEGKALASRFPEDSTVRSELRLLPGLLGQIYLELGLVDLAAQKLQRERELIPSLRESGSSYYRSTIAAHLRQANLAFAQDRYKKVVRLIDGYLDYEELYGLFPQWADTHRILKAWALIREVGGIQEQAGSENLEQAVSLLKDALEQGRLESGNRRLGQALLARALLGQGHLSEVGELLTSLPAQEQKDSRVSRESMELRCVRAQWALRSKASNAELSSCRSDLEAGLADRLELWSILPQRGGGVSFLRFQTAREWVVTLIELSLALEPKNPERALRAVIDVQNQGSLIRAHQAARNLEELRSFLFSSEPEPEFGGDKRAGLRGALLYVPGAWASHAFAVDQKAVTHFKLPAGRVLGELVFNHNDVLRKLCDDSDSKSLASKERESAKALSRDLLPEELRTRIASWESVYLVGNDMLGSAAFEFLPFGDESHWGLTKDLVEVSSLPLAALCSQRAGEATLLAKDLVLLAAPETSQAVRERWPQATAFEISDKDLNAVLGVYPPSRRVLWRGIEASFERLQDLSQVGVLQLIAHGVRDDSLERISALALAPSASNTESSHSGVLTCAEVDQLAAPRWVFLSSCRSGVGPSRPGDEELGHMGGAWMAAGASGVLLAETDLRLSHALALSKCWHAGLSSGLSPAASLRRARLQLVRDGVTANPVSLGRVRLLGAGHDVLFAR